MRLQILGNGHTLEVYNLWCSPSGACGGYLLALLYLTQLIQVHRMLNFRQNQSAANISPNYTITMLIKTGF